MKPNKCKECGNDPIIEPIYPNDPDRHPGRFIECEDCPDALLFGRTLEEATELWNKDFGEPADG